MYDSTNDTLDHISKLKTLLKDIIVHISFNAEKHDKSKLEEPEKGMYDKYTPLLKDTTYGSDQYKQYLKEMGSALEHHYQYNQHHPEFWGNGINDMSLIDIIEMVADWKAASLRHSDGSIIESLKINKDRFGISDQLIRVIENTVREMGW